MDLLRRDALNDGSVESPCEERMMLRWVDCLPVSWDAALAEAEQELARARVLVESLETLTAHLRHRVSPGVPFSAVDAGNE